MPASFLQTLIWVLTKCHFWQHSAPCSPFVLHPTYSIAVPYMSINKLYFLLCNLPISLIRGLLISYMEKEMATQSSVHAWRIPGTGEPGGLPSMGSHRVRQDWSDLAAAAAAVWLHWEKTSGSLSLISNSIHFIFFPPLLILLCIFSV